MLPTRTDLRLGAALALVIAVCYLPLFPLPLVQDDWGVLAQLRILPAGDQLAWLFDVDRRLFLRPGGLAALLAEHSCFGADATGYRIVALVLHATASLLVTAVLRTTLGDARVAWSAGFLYAAATSVHLDPMIWAVGIFDLGAMCGALACMLCFLRGRPLRAAAALLLAVSFKEWAVMVPFALAALVAAGGAAVRVRALAWLPLLIVVALYLALKAACASPFALPPEAPYAMALSGPHVADNARRYFGWAAQAILPLQFAPLVLAVVGGAMVVVAVVARQRLAAELRPRAWRLVGHLLWALCMLAPVLFLRQHSYRYYLMPALPGLLAISGTIVLAVLGTWRGSQVRTTALFAVATAAAIACSLVHLATVVREGPRQAALAWGTNHLVARGHVAAAMRAALPRTLPANAVVVCSGVDLVALDGASAIRVWTDAPGIDVVAVEHLDAAERARLRTGSRPLFGFVWREDRVFATTAVDLLAAGAPK